MESAPAAGPPSDRVLILEAGRTERNYWSDLWTYRELFLILGWRDVAVQYKQSVIGFAWALLRPLLTMIVFTVVFGKLSRLPTDGSAPYPIMVMAGMLPWFLLSTMLGQGANSLIQNAGLVGKVYFPRLIVPVASSVVALVDFLVTLLLMVGVMAIYRYWPDWRLLFLPAFILLAVVAALGPVLILAALNVKYRDFRFIVPFIVQFGLYVSPVGFSSNVIPEEWRLLYSLNPAVGVIDGFRWSLLAGQSQINWAALGVSVAVSLVLLAIGIRVFRATEKSFADLV